MTAYLLVCSFAQLIIVLPTIIFLLETAQFCLGVHAMAANMYIFIVFRNVVAL